MPFVGREQLSSAQELIKSDKSFVGRENELTIFLQEMLQAEIPPYNILSIWGEGGIGKSTLLDRFESLASTTGYREYCRSALVRNDSSPFLTLPEMMKTLAKQLHIAGEFEKAFDRYNEALQKLELERRSTGEETWNKAATDFAVSLAKEVPLVGDPAGKGIELLGKFISNEVKSRQHLNYVKRLDNPIQDLTQAFVKELNRLTGSEVEVGSHHMKRKRRVILRLLS